MANPVYLTTPIGRFVSGDLFNPQTRDAKGNTRATPQFYIGLAIPKTDPEFATFWGQVQAVAQRDWPGGEYQQPTFAWKMVDGDDPKHSAKSGHAGNWVLRLTSGFAPDVYDQNNQQIVDPNAIQRGYFLRVNIGVQGNGPNTQSPGVYLNLGMVKLVAYGEVINSRPDVNTVFAGAETGALPPGASPTPVAPASQMPAAPVPAPAVPGVAPVPAPAVPGVAPAVPLATAPPVAAPPIPGAPGAAPATPGAALPNYLDPQNPGQGGAGS